MRAVSGLAALIATGRRLVSTKSPTQAATEHAVPEVSEAQLEREFAKVQIDRLGLCADGTLFEENTYLVELNSCVPLRFGAYSYCHSPILHAVEEVGRYCSIAHGVVFGEHEHDMTRLTSSAITTSRASSIFRKVPFPRIPYPPFGKTVIGNDVWIGARAYLRSGVTISDGAVIGAQAVVTRDVPPYAVVVGNPGRVVKYRFPPELVAALLAFRWWRFDFAAFDGVDILDPARALAQLRAMEEAGTLAAFHPAAVDPRMVRLRSGSAETGW